MFGLGSPQYNQNTNTSESEVDKLSQLEARIAKLEKTLGWIKWVIAFIGIFILTNNNNNKNEN